METGKKTIISIETLVNIPVEKVWEFWTKPEHIMQWTQASDDWHAPYADNDLRVGGKFKTTMAAKDGSFSFDFEGSYTSVDYYKVIAYEIEDERRVEILFEQQGDNTKIIETFEAEEMNSIEMQRDGWQSILNNFKKYAEAN